MKAGRLSWGILVAAVAALALAPSAFAAAGKIVFTSSRDGDDEIFVMNGDGSGQTQLTFNSVTDYLPAWSADGKRIAFVSYRDGEEEIFVMNADGLGQTQLTFNTVGDFGPDWSPDGKKLVFSSEQDAAPNADLFTLGLDGSGQTRLTFEPEDVRFPRYSPNGAQLVSLDDPGAGTERIVVRNADGSGRNELAMDAIESPPDFTADGKHITFSSDRDGDNEIFTMNALDGSGETQLTFNTGGISGNDFDASPTRDGLNRIVFTSRRDPEANREIFVMNFDGSGVTQLTFTGAGQENYNSDSQPTATCQGKLATIVGTAASETLSGGAGPDVISAQGGKDTVKGLAGNDVICGDAGKDNLNGGKGKDTVVGGTGKDKLAGAKGKDRCIGGKGSDSAKGCEKTRSL